jgi:hypothetical protein
MEAVTGQDITMVTGMAIMMDTMVVAITVVAITVAEATIMVVLIIMVRGAEVQVELPFHDAMEVVRRMGLPNGHKEPLKQWLEAAELHLLPAPIR